MKLFGIDISEHNGNVDMKKIKNSGVKFAIIRASWGHFQEDKQARNNVKKCNDVGLNYGLYHYSYARTDAEARQEAENFLKLAKQFSGRSYPLVLDMEDANGWKKGQGVSMAQEVRTIRIWKEIIEGAGQYLMLYCNKDWWNRLRAIDAKLIDSIDLWLAHWGIAEPSVNCGIWQYSSDGKVNGSSARTDVNYAYKDYPSIIKGSASKPSKPSKKPVTDKVVNDVINGKYGNGDVRKQKLEKEGYNYNEVQDAVNKKLSKPKKSISEIAKEVIAGKWGNGEVREKKLKDAGYDYKKVQAEVNKQMGASAPKKSVDAVAKEIINKPNYGGWGTGETRKKKLTEYGGASFAEAVQKRINELM